MLIELLSGVDDIAKGIVIYSIAEGYSVKIGGV